MHEHEIDAFFGMTFHATLAMVDAGLREISAVFNDCSAEFEVKNRQIAWIWCLNTKNKYQICLRMHTSIDVCHNK